MRTEPPEAAFARERAGRLLQQHLDRWILGGGRDERVVDEFVDGLARLYRVKRWSARGFDRAVVRGAFAGWRPGTRAAPAGDGLRVVSPTCPLGAVAEDDPAACGLCRSFHEAVVRRTLPGVRSVSFAGLIAHGEGACEMDVGPIGASEGAPRRPGRSGSAVSR